MKAYYYSYRECPFSKSSWKCWGNFCLSSSSVPTHPATTTHSFAGRRGCNKIVSPWKQCIVPAGRLSSTHAAGGWMDSCTRVCPFSGQLCTPMSLLQTAVHAHVPSPDSCEFPCPFSGYLCTPTSLLWTAVHSHVPSFGTAAGTPTAGQCWPQVQQPPRTDQRLIWTFYH